MRGFVCPLVRPSVRRSVSAWAWVKKWENVHICPCPPVRNWRPCIRPCSSFDGYGICDIWQGVGLLFTSFMIIFYTWHLCAKFFFRRWSCVFIWWLVLESLLYNRISSIGWPNWCRKFSPLCDHMFWTLPYLTQSSCVLWFSSQIYNYFDPFDQFVNPCMII